VDTERLADANDPYCLPCRGGTSSEARNSDGTCADCDALLGFYDIYGDSDTGATACKNCNYVIRPLNGCCTINWMDLVGVIFMSVFTSICIAMWSAIIFSLYTAVKFQRQADIVTGKLVSKRTWSETTGSGKNRKTVHYYKLTIKYPSQGESLATSPFIIHKEFDTDSGRYEHVNYDSNSENNSTSMNTMQILRMPIPYDPRRAHLKEDVAASFGFRDDDFTSLLGVLWCALRTFGNIFCVSLVTAIYLLVLGMITTAAFLLNFSLPFCYANLITWPMMILLIFRLCKEHLWNWAERDLEGTMVENNGRHTGSVLEENRSERNFAPVVMGSTRSLHSGDRNADLLHQSYRNLASALGAYKSGNSAGEFVGVVPSAPVDADGEMVIPPLGAIPPAAGSEKWGSVSNGHICCGPGMIYIHDENVMVMKEDVTTEEAARAKVAELSAAEPDNPVIMWQLANPWSDGAYEGSKPWDEQFLIAMKKSFLVQPGVTTGRSPKAFAETVASYQIGRVWGSKLYYMDY
jgi:hypothetical protein